MRLFATTSFCLVLISCGPKLKPPRYIDSPAFHAVSGSVYGILDRDIDGDGQSDATVVVRAEQGYVVEVLRQEGKKEAPAWKPLCRSETLLGNDLDAMRWLDAKDEPLLYVVVLDEDPEELRQSVAVIDATDCSSALYEKLSVRRKERDAIITPESFRQGAMLSKDAGTLTIIDEPRYLRLGGAAGDVEILSSVRQRDFVFADGETELTEQPRGLLTPVSLAIEGPSGIEVLYDGDDGTHVAIAAGASLVLGMRSERPWILLELHHGCDEDPAAPLSVMHEGEVFTLGQKPGAGSFVLAYGRKNKHAGIEHDLLALRTKTALLELTIQGDTKTRCLREVRAYGFITDTAFPEGDEHAL